MRGIPALLLVALLGSADPARAGVFRCARADGSVRFVDSPHACGGDGAEAHAPPERLQRLPAPAGSAGEASDGSAEASRAGPEIAALWLDAAALGPGWEVVRELPTDPSRDPDLVGWGVLAQEARHYTHRGGDQVQVCSVEIWAFEDVGHARAAHEGFAYPNWEIHQEGTLLVMLRGVDMGPGREPRRGVFADCRSLGERIRARARPASAGREEADSMSRPTRSEAKPSEGQSPSASD